MTLVYHVRPRDQWCDPVDGSEQFVTKADFDSEVSLWKDNHKFASNLADDLTQDSMALMRLLADEKHKSEDLAASLASCKAFNEQLAQGAMGNLDRIRALEAALRHLAETGTSVQRGEAKAALCVDGGPICRCGHSYASHDKNVGDCRFTDQIGFCLCTGFTPQRQLICDALNEVEHGT